RAPEARAEPARVARRPSVEGPRVDRHGEGIGGVAEMARPRLEEEAGVHGRVGWLRELPVPRSPTDGIEGRRRHLRHVTLHPEPGFYFVVEGGYVVVGERPVGHVGPGDRTVEGQALEVLVP